jgi:hypothetical protein
MHTHTHTPKTESQQVMQDYLPILHYGISHPSRKANHLLENYLPIMYCGIVTQTEVPPTRYARLPTHYALWNSHPNRKKCHQHVMQDYLPTHSALWNSPVLPNSFCWVRQKQAGIACLAGNRCSHLSPLRNRMCRVRSFHCSKSLEGWIFWPECWPIPAPCFAYYI